MVVAMKRLLLLLLPVLVSAQIHAKVETVNQRQTEYLSNGKLVCIETRHGKDAIVKLTVLAAEFAILADGRSVDVKKSVVATLLDAKKNNTTIELVDEKGHKIKCDPAKESDASIISILEGAVKNGYRKQEKIPEILPAKEDDNVIKVKL
jgi:hypothetical protein